MRINSAVIGAGVGASLMFLLDPSRGARRRSLLRDRIVHGLHKTGDAAGSTFRDVSHRLTGVAAGARRLVSRGGVSDEVLEARVRARLGRYSSHPAAIRVTPEDGVVTLDGDVLRQEYAAIISATAATRGVLDIVDRLAVHDSAEGVPSLQGGVARRGDRPDFLQTRWAPATRCTVATAGATVLAYGLGRRDAAGAGLALVGTAMLLRSITNLETRRLIGIGAGRRAVDVQKTITINAPVDLVFEQWADVERFPALTSHVLEVRPTRVEGQTHWTVTGPIRPIEFDAEITELIPDELIAWRTVEGSAVQHAGIVRFEPSGEDATRVDVRVSYNPPGGALGDAAAAMFHRDLRSQLDDDLLRLKSFLETGQPAHDAADPIR